jgi:hypothetical protein
MTLQMIVYKTVTVFGGETPDMILVASVKGWENWSTIWMMTAMGTVIVIWYSNIARNLYLKVWYPIAKTAMMKTI